MREVPYLLLSALFGPVMSSYLTLAGLQLTSVPTAAIVSRFDTFFLLLMHPAPSVRSVRPLALLCAAALVAGLFITAFDDPPKNDPRFPQGVALLFGGALFSALDQALIRRKLSHVSVRHHSPDIDSH